MGKPLDEHDDDTTAAPGPQMNLELRERMNASYADYDEPNEDYYRERLERLKQEQASADS